MDIAGLSKLTADSIILIISVLGFMVNAFCWTLSASNEWSIQTFGFATEEFQVTADRLGVYLPVVSGAMNTILARHLTRYCRSISIILSLW